MDVSRERSQNGRLEHAFGKKQRLFYTQTLESLSRRKNVQYPDKCHYTDADATGPLSCSVIPVINLSLLGVSESSCCVCISSLYLHVWYMMHKDVGDKIHGSHRCNLEMKTRNTRGETNWKNITLKNVVCSCFNENSLYNAVCAHFIHHTRTDFCCLCKCKNVYYKLISVCIWKVNEFPTLHIWEVKRNLITLMQISITLPSRGQVV